MGTNTSKSTELPENNRKTKSKGIPSLQPGSYIFLEDINEIIIYSNGDKYEGQVRDNEISGFGTYFYRSNDVYKGEWYLRRTFEMCL